MHIYTHISMHIHIDAHTHPKHNINNNQLNMAATTKPPITKLRTTNHSLFLFFLILYIIIKKIKKRPFTYPTTGINGGPYRPISEIDQFPDFINIRIRTTRKHGPATRESKPVPFVMNPILLLLLHGQLLVRHIRVPNRVSALRPPKWHLIPVGRRNPALEKLLLLRAMPLPVNQPLPFEFQRPRDVLARRVLAELCVAGRQVSHTRRRGR